MARSKNTTTWQDLVAGKYPEACQRGEHNWFKGANDEFISQCFPGFFLDMRHRGLQPGEEWHICRGCGQAKLVKPPPPRKEIIPIPVPHVYYEAFNNGHGRKKGPNSK